MDFSETTNISFDEIFGSSPEDVSIEKLESFLEEVVSDSFKDSAASPDELVRVVGQNGIQWMTAEEAEAYARSSSENQDETLKQNLHHAMRSDSRVLAQELRIVFLLANSTLNKYRDQKLIPIGEVQRTEPLLTRLSRQVSFELGALREVEDRMKEVRQKHPVLAEFEKKMGLLLKFQKNGDSNKAIVVAKELAAIKNTYVRISRGLTSDTNESTSHRIDLQRQKKSIISCHKYLAAQREGVLQTEIQDLRESVKSLKAVLAKSADHEKERYEVTLNHSETQLDKNETELNVVQKERTILEIKEKETEALITKMETTVQSGSLVAKEKPVQEKPAAPPESTPPEPEPEVVEEKSKASIRRMHTATRRGR